MTSAIRFLEKKYILVLVTGQISLKTLAYQISAKKPILCTPSSGIPHRAGSYQTSTTEFYLFNAHNEFLLDFLCTSLYLLTEYTF